MRALRACVGAAIALSAAGAPLAAQSGPLRAQCAEASSSEVRVLCENVADAAVILPPRVALALSGGNPVTGTASTLGMRIGSLPRTSLGLRVSAATASLPPIERAGATANVGFPLASINADVSLGVFQGFALLPTVGGFGSVDLLGSAGIVRLPRGDDFIDGSAGSWAIGARVGVLRESFTAPGVSIDVLHRRTARLSWGAAETTSPQPFLRVDGLRTTSLRGVIGKRMFGVGLTGGVAWDRATTDIEARISDPGLLQPDRVLQLRHDGLAVDRTAVFGNASLTLLILNLAAEAGWQRGGSPIQGATDRLQRGSPFGSLAVRLAI